MEQDTLGPDILMQNPVFVEFQTRLVLNRLKTMGFWSRLVLKRWVKYLNKGAGYPCAGQSNAKPCSTFFTYHAILKSVENVGAFRPTGSKNKRVLLLLS